MNTFTNKHGVKIIIAIVLISLMISAFWTGAVGFVIEHAVSPDESSIEYMIDYWMLGDNTTEGERINALGIYFWWLLEIGVYFTIFMQTCIFGLLILALVNFLETRNFKTKVLNQPMQSNQPVQNNDTVNLNKEQ